MDGSPDAENGSLGQDEGLGTSNDSLIDMQHALLVADVQDNNQIEGSCPSDLDEGPLPPADTDSDVDNEGDDDPDASKDSNASAFGGDASGSSTGRGRGDGSGGVWRRVYGGLGGVGVCCGPRLAAVWQLGDRGACTEQTSVNKACLHPNMVVAGLSNLADSAMMVVACGGACTAVSAV